MRKYFPWILFLLFLGACGGRTPSPHTAQDIVKDYFNDYGEKYKESSFGNRKVQAVEILTIEEIQKNLSYGEAIVTLDNSSVYKVRMNFIKKAPLGWRTQGWELLGSSSATP